MMIQLHRRNLQGNYESKRFQDATTKKEQCILASEGFKKRSNLTIDVSKALLFYLKAPARALFDKIHGFNNLQILRVFRSKN